MNLHSVDIGSLVQNSIYLGSHVNMPDKLISNKTKRK